MPHTEDAQEKAEHDTFLMLYNEPERLMTLFHDNATIADLDDMDDALIKYMQSVGENEYSPLYDAVVRIIKECEL